MCCHCCRRRVVGCVIVVGCGVMRKRCCVCDGSETTISVIVHKLSRRGFIAIAGLFNSQNIYLQKITEKKDYGFDKFEQIKNETATVKSVLQSMPWVICSCKLVCATWLEVLEQGALVFISKSLQIFTIVDTNPRHVSRHLLSSSV